ncbi:hypothetical protein PAXRUDRAFT_567782 [Paxillus rubicundulus Ve08.2h10]|uniref:Uncharacterized protein n=1 Tax=Paxillus rubicundulus Ve08.2h10 TaxID=930991 RepID=A0A0D0DUB3_9AGAM|nr:hypothetical protein PAXRUDRAFT_567782 [Paxillus rubicundulus Ve08.2h10]
MCFTFRSYKLRGANRHTCTTPGSRMGMNIVKETEYEGRHPISSRSQLERDVRKPHRTRAHTRGI